MADRKKCRHCGRTKGERKVPRCARCPGQPVTARLMEQPCRAVTLIAQDPGAAGGVAVFHRGDLRLVEPVDWYTRRPTEVAEEAARLAERDGTALVMVAEEWGAGGYLNPATVESLAATFGIMKREARLVGVPASRVRRIHTATWRAAFGARSGRDSSEEWKAWAKARASRLAGFPIASADAAEAYLVGWVFLRLPECVDVVPKRVLRRFA